ncbi:MAG: endonuclease III [Candidatus Omnitrophota bacterium]|jgi:endonuclease-3
MQTVSKTLRLIRKQAQSFTVPSVTEIAFAHDPYLVLISCILSLRTKDKTTLEASRRLFAVADNPKAMSKLSKSLLQKLIYPVGFYRNKSKVILDVSNIIVNDFCGRVPPRREDLLAFKGVGPKTANLVLGLGFGIPAICVDTHVHRISNRLGWVKTHEPVETEEALKKIVPRDYWIELNTLLVAFGQNICVPVSPFCSRCFVQQSCKKEGVRQQR